MTLGGAFTMPNGDILVQPKRGNVLITFENEEHSTTICPIIEGTGLGVCDSIISHYKFKLPISLFSHDQIYYENRRVRPPGVSI